MANLTRSTLRSFVSSVLEELNRPNLTVIESACLTRVLLALGDRLTAELTATGDRYSYEGALTELCEQWKLHGYRPTLRPSPRDERYEVLADLYDWWMTERGEEARAFRG